MAIDIVDLLDGYKPQSGRTELMNGPDLGQHVDTGWIRNMTWVSYGWEEMGKDCMPGEVRMAWRPIEDALGTVEMNQLKVLAHQLKGAAGGYGFVAISKISSTLEGAVIAGADKSTLTGHVATLASMCAQIRGMAA